VPGISGAPVTADHSTTAARSPCPTHGIGGILAAL
jgi:hypothetical protein